MIEPPFKLRNQMEEAFWAYLTSKPLVEFAGLGKVYGSSDHAQRQFWNLMRRYNVLRKVGHVGSRVLYTTMDKETAEAARKAMRQSSEGAMWTAIRVQKEFTPEDIFAALSGGPITINLKAIQTYCRYLTEAGFLKVLLKRIQGVRPARYRLIRDPGPLPIEVKRKLVLIDRNEERVVHVQGAQI